MRLVDHGTGHSDVAEALRPLGNGQWTSDLIGDLSISGPMTLRVCLKEPMEEP